MDGSVLLPLVIIELFRPLKARFIENCSTFVLVVKTFPVISYLFFVHPFEFLKVAYIVCSRRGRSAASSTPQPQANADPAPLPETRTARPQSLNQESVIQLIRNLLIRESPNQLINQSRRHMRTAAKICAKVLKFRLLPGEGQSNPKTQTTRGGGLIASASGIGRSPAFHSWGNPLAHSPNQPRSVRIGIHPRETHAAFAR